MIAQQVPRTVRVGGRDVATDAEGYLLDLDDWSEDFARALAREEGLELTPRHWELIRFLREHYQTHGVQAQVRAMVRHFSARELRPTAAHLRYFLRRPSRRRLVAISQPGGTDHWAR